MKRKTKKKFKKIPEQKFGVFTTWKSIKTLKTKTIFVISIGHKMARWTRIDEMVAFREKTAVQSVSYLDIFHKFPHTFLGSLVFFS